MSKENENQNGFNPGEMPQTNNEREKINLDSVPKTENKVSFDTTAIPVINENQNKFNPGEMPTTGSSQGSTGESVISKLTKNKPLFFGILGGVGVLVIIIIIVVIVGGKNKLVCTKTEEIGGVKWDTKIIFKFKGDAPSATMIASIDYSDDPSFNEEEMKKEAEEANKEFKEKNINMKYELSGKKVIMTSEYTPEKYKEEYKREYEKIKDKNKEGYKKYYEEEKKYTCK